MAGRMGRSVRRNSERRISMSSAGCGYIALPQGDVAILTTTMIPRTSAISGGSISGLWRRSGVGQLPVSVSSDIELDELTSVSTTTTMLTSKAVSPPLSHLDARDQNCPLLPRSPPASPTDQSSPPPKFQIGNSSCSVPATSRVKRRLE